MTKIILSGCGGRMGREIAQLASQHSDLEIIAGVDKHKPEDLSFPVYTQFADVDQKADCLIDFSNPSALDEILAYCKATGTPVVLATTGYSEEQFATIQQASEEVAVFYSANMSLGINLLVELSQIASKILGKSFDIEIIEKHHNQKVDAPSGTALLLANSINEKAGNTYEYVYNREDKRQKRDANEIGIHAVRGGTIVGEHEVIFAGQDEIISLSHSAYSRQVFATGGLKAAQFVAGKPAGMYSMKDLIESTI